MIVFRYAPQKKWKREGINSMISLFVLIIVFFLSLGKIGIGYSLFLVIPMAAVLIRALHFFQLPHKNYLMMEDDFLSIYRGIVWPRKKLLFEHVEHVALFNEVIVFKLKGGKEETIYTDLLLSPEQQKLKDELKVIFAAKVVGF